MKEVNGSLGVMLQLSVPAKKPKRKNPKEAKKFG